MVLFIMEENMFWIKFINQSSQITPSSLNPLT